MAKTDYFLKIDGIEGESQDAKMQGCIDLQSWSWGESNTGSFAAGGGGGSGKVSMQDFHFTMQINKASPKLALYCATGKHIPYAELTCRKAGDKPAVYLKIKLSDVLISNYQTGGSANADILPYDQVSINFAKIEGEYFIQDSKGATSSAGKWGYDLKKNEKIS